MTAQNTSTNIATSMKGQFIFLVFIRCNIGQRLIFRTTEQKNIQSVEKFPTLLFFITSVVFHAIYFIFLHSIATWISHSAKRSGVRSLASFESSRIEVFLLLLLLVTTCVTASKDKLTAGYWIAPSV